MHLVLALLLATTCPASVVVNSQGLSTVYKAECAPPGEEILKVSKEAWAIVEQAPHPRRPVHRAKKHVSSKVHFSCRRRWYLNSEGRKKYRCYRRK